MAEMASNIVARVSQSQDPNIGSARASSSATQVVSTLVPVLLVAVVYMIIFLIFRRIFARNYRPRTFLSSLRQNELSPKISDSLFGWIPDFYRIPDTWILNHHTLDGFLFLRFLKICAMMCVVGCLIAWPVLLPINATGGGGHTQLDLLTMANVTNNYYKLFAHAGCAIIFYSFVIYIITRECIYFINLRQAYLLSPFYSARISARTVLFCSVPKKYMDEAKLRLTLGPGVRRVWFARKTDEIEDKVDERDKAAMRLEGAETKLIQAANGARLKAEKKGTTPSSPGATLEGGVGTSAERYITQKQRPTHRLKPLIGKKVDTIDWCRAELSRLIPEVNQMQREQTMGHCEKLNSVFVEFESLSEAQSAYQSLTHHQVLQMAPRYTGMDPTEVIWSNLKISWLSRLVRGFAVTAIVVALIIFWSIPVAFVGAISNVNYLIGILPWLSFIKTDVPKVILGVITGLLPVVLLAVLMMLLPIFLRFMAKVKGDPTLSAVELSVQNYYFAFQVVQVFLVATLGSAASASISKIISNPSIVPSLLATKIPLANNFYLCYFILQGLGSVGGILAGLTGLLVFLILGKLLDKTPRKKYKRWITLSSMGWGTVMPIYTNLFVIALCYAVVAPLVLGFAALGLALFYVAFRYNLMFVTDARIDTKGAIYPRALQQLFVGLYVAEICLIGLFAINTGASVGALGPLILMILFLVFTALYNVALNSALKPLLTYLPRSMDAEERSLLAAETGVEYGPNRADTNYTDDGRHSSETSYTDERKEANLSTTSRSGYGSGDETLPPKTNTNEKAQPNALTKFLRPDKHSNYHALRALVPNHDPIAYSRRIADEAYFHPAITSPTPLLWIPRDPAGISAREVHMTRNVIPITDEGAYLDEKNRIVWDALDGRPPIFEEKVYY